MYAKPFISVAVLYFLMSFPPLTYMQTYIYIYTYIGNYCDIITWKYTENIIFSINWFKVEVTVIISCKH